MVPSRFFPAIRCFLTQPSVSIISSGVVTFGTLRESTFFLLDTGVVASAVGFWLVQEWILHKYFLHQPGWIGFDIHQEHHRRPYFHISLDDPKIVLSWGLVATAIVFFFTQILRLPFQSLGMTWLTSYWTMGLLYEFTHYIVHTRVKPVGPIWKSIKKNHIRHHLTDSDDHFSFLFPLLDKIFRK